MSSLKLPPPPLGVETTLALLGAAYCRMRRELRHVQRMREQHGTLSQHYREAITVSGRRGDELEARYQEVGDD